MLALLAALSPESRRAFAKASPATRSTFRRLATGEGRRALLEAARDRELPLADLAALPAPDFAAQLLARASTDAAARAVVLRAALHVARQLASVPVRHFRTALGDPLRPFDPAVFARAFAAHAPDGLLPSSAAIDPRVEVLEDGFLLDVVRDDAPVALLTRAAGGALARTVVSPVVVDALRWCSRRQRISLAVPDRALLAPYRAAFGVALFDDPRAFPARAYCTLEPLLDRGADALTVPLPAGVRRVRCIALVWDTGVDGIAFERGRDVFAALRRRGISLAGGRILAATLRFELAGVPEPVDAQIRVPYRLTIEPPAHAPLVEDALDAMGITRPAFPRMDLATLAHQDLGLEMMNDTFGATRVAAMTDLGLLVAGERRAVEHPDHRDAPRALIVFPLDDGDGYGVPAEDEDVPPCTVSRADLAALRLDVDALAHAIATDLFLQGDVGAIEHRHGLLDVGHRVLGPTGVRVFVATRPLDVRGLADELRRRAMPYHALVITPEGRPLNIGLAEVPLSLAFLEGPHHCLLPAIVHALGLADAVEAPLAAPAGTRFALDTRTGDVFLDGLLLDALAPAPKKFLTLLLKARGERVSTEAINDAIARTRGDDGAARQMKRRALLQIAESFRKAGRRPSGPVDDLIVRDKDGGYRVAASIFVR